MIAKINFDEWISRVFDRPEDLSTMHPPLADGFWIRDDSRTAALIAETFARSAELTPRFSDRQLEAGLWLILNDGYCANAMSKSVPIERRLGVLDSTVPLFASLFRVRCTALDLGGELPLYRVCYMFWELLKNGGGEPAERSRLTDRRFAALESILKIDNSMCQYSALHGLGHLSFKEPARTASVIDRFLERHGEPDFPLLAYALDAREGNVQ